MAFLLVLSLTFVLAYPLIVESSSNPDDLDSFNKNNQEFNYTLYEYDYLTFTDNGVSFDIPKTLIMNDTFSGDFFSFSIWVNLPSSNEDWKEIWGTSGSTTRMEVYTAFDAISYRLYNSTGGYVELYVSDFYTPNEWFNAIVTYNATEGKARSYRNGELVDIDDFTGSLALWSGNLSFMNGLNGSIDEVRIYNKTLNITEVENIYSAKRAYTNQTISSDGLILWLPINEKSGTDVFDATGNLGNGDLTGSDYEWTNGDLTEIKWIWDNSNYTIYNDNNLILMLNLDNRSSLGEDSITIKDLSSEGNDGVIYNTINGVMTSNGKYNGALSSNEGIKGHIRIPNQNSLTNLSNNFTLMAWINPAEEAGGSGDRFIILGKDYDLSNYGFFLGLEGYDSTEELEFRINGQDSQRIIYDYDFSLDKWTHVAVTYIDGNATLFINGDFVKTAIVGDINGSSGRDLAIGASNVYATWNDGSWRFNGSIDEVRVWNKTLSFNEVSQMYSSQVTKYDLDSWGFYINQTEVDGTYNYAVCSINSEDDEECFTTETINFDTAYPQFIEIDAPEVTTSNSTINIDYNITESNLDKFKFIWNNTNLSFLGDDVIMFYNFNNRSSLGENDSYVKDLSGNGFDLNSFVGAEWSEDYGKYNGAFKFNGTQSQDVLVSPLFNNSNEYSFCFWLNATPEYADSWQTIMYRQNTANRNNEFGIYIRNGTIGSDYIAFEFWDEAGAGAEFSQTYGGIYNQGYLHFCNTVDGNTNLAKLYVNGVLDETDTIVNHNVTNIEGRIEFNKDFNGSIDDFIMLNRSLSADEVNQIYSASFTKYDSSNWNFYINKTIPITSGDSLDYTYSLCGEDLLNGENCTTTNTITRIPENIMVFANFTNELFTVIDNMNGVGTHSSFASTDTVTYTNDCSTSRTANYTDSRQKLLESGIKTIRRDMNLQSRFSSGETLTGGSQDREIVEFAYNNGLKVLYIADYTPIWLANTTDGYCAEDEGYGYITCNPTNITKWAELSYEALRNFTNNWEYLDAIEGVQIRNEPYHTGFWLSNLSNDHQIKADLYWENYNISYYYWKALNPSINIIGASFYADSAPNMANTWISNMAIANNSDGWAISDYVALNNFDVYKERIDWMLGRCDVYGADCTNIYITETNLGWNTGYSHTNKHYAILGNSLIDSLNNYADRIHVMTFKWEVNNYNISCSGYNGDYAIYSEFDTLPSGARDTIQNFAELCSAQSKVFSSSPISSNLKMLTCNKGEDYNTMLINIGTDALNLSVNLSGSYPYNNVTDFETKEITALTSEIAEMGSLASNEIMYLSSGVAPTITNLNNNSYVNSSSVNFTANLTDGISLKNATLNIYNGSLITRVITYVSGEISVIQSWIVDLADGVYTWWISLWDDEEQNTISSNQTWTVDTIYPTIEFTSPTEGNGSILSETSLFINYSTGDLNNVYSFTDFDNSIIGWWRFEDLANDEFGNYNGIINGTSKISNGIFGEAYNFDGINDEITGSFTTPIDLTNNGSLSLWFKVPAITPASEYLFTLQAGDRFVGRLKNDGNLNFIVYDTTWRNTEASSNYPTDEWVHAVFIWTTNDFYIYMNGVNGTHISRGTQSPATSSSFVFGNSLITNYLNGSMDEIILFNRSITQEEVLSLYNSTSTYHNFTSLGEGIYDIQSYVVDQAGNINETELRTLTLDTTQPTLNITYPLNTSYNLNVTELNYTIIDVNPDSCWYSIDGGATNSTSVVAGVNFTGITSVEGSNTWTVYCNDSAGNENSTSVTFFFKDDIDPVVSKSTPISGLSTTSTQILYTYMATDTNVISNCSLVINDTIQATNTSVSNQSINHTFDFAYSPRGNFNWSIQCYDNYGNLGTTGNIEIELRTEAGYVEGGSTGGGSTSDTNDTVLGNYTTPVSNVTNQTNGTNGTTTEPVSTWSGDTREQMKKAMDFTKYWLFEKGWAVYLASFFGIILMLKLTFGGNKKERKVNRGFPDRRFRR